MILTKITERLWIGDAECLRQRKTLLGHHIDVIIVLALECAPTCLDGIIIHRAGMHDEMPGLPDNTDLDIIGAVEALNEFYNRGLSVLCLCRDGCNRSVALIAAFLTRRHLFATVLEAYSHVRVLQGSANVEPRLLEHMERVCIPPKDGKIPRDCFIAGRNDGMQWVIDPRIERSDLGLVDHEDWIHFYFPTQSDAVILDVGAFVGIHAIWMAKRCKRVLAFEPNPETLSLLEANVALNQAKNIDVLPVALSSRSGMLRFRQEDYTSRLDPSGGIEIPCTTMDDACAALERIDFVKIDTEGEEAEVLRGSLGVVRRFRPRFLVEVHSHMEGRHSNGDLVMKWCSENNYDCRRIWENSPGYYYVELTPTL